MNLTIFDIDETLTVAVDDICFVQACRDVLGPVSFCLAARSHRPSSMRSGPPPDQIRIVRSLTLSMNWTSGL